MSSTDLEPQLRRAQELLQRCAPLTQRVLEEFVRVYKNYDLSDSTSTLLVQDLCATLHLDPEELEAHMTALQAMVAVLKKVNADAKQLVVISEKDFCAQLQCEPAALAEVIKDLNATIEAKGWVTGSVPIQLIGHPSQGPKVVVLTALCWASLGGKAEACG